MKVSAIVVTRGDVKMDGILDSLPAEWEKIVWVNGRGVAIVPPGGGVKYQEHFDTDLSVYGRYAAIEHATGDVIYVQDDDCVVSDPAKLLEQWLVPAWGRQDHVVCNMPLEFRHDFYQAHALVGFGAVFYRDAPSRAFERFGRWQAFHADLEDQIGTEAERRFYDTCDIVFTGLTPRVLVDMAYENLPHAYAENRMYKQERHVADRAQMLAWVKEAAK